MKNLLLFGRLLNRPYLRNLFVILTFLLSSNYLVAQHQLIQVDGWNCYIYLPEDYSQSNKNYPAILFMPGIGEVGTNASSVIQNGPGAYIRGGWNGNAFGVQFIIISLQPPGTWPTGKEIHDKMVKIRQQYRIGEVYMTGLSMGGHSTHAYTTEYPDEVKSIVTVEGVGLNATEAEQMPKWSLWLDQGNRVICFEQKNDLRGGTWVTGFLNKYKANSAVYILTNFGGGGHCCWSEFYGGPGKQPGIFNIDGINQTIYEWFAREYLKKNDEENIPPIANAGINQTITLPANKVTLSGSGTDSDGTVVGYEWTKISGPNSYTIVSPTSATTEVKDLTEGSYTFQLKVTDNKGATGTATVKVTVNPAPNKAPTANAGQNQTITLPINTVTLNGSGTDEDGTITAYEWTKTAGPNGYTIVSPNSATTEVKNLTEGTYTFQLKVTDDKGATGTATVKVIVNAAPNKAPTANAGQNQTITLPTNTVTLNGSGTDEDGTITAYEWTKTAGPTSYTIVSPNSATTEVRNLTEGTYTFQLKVTDNRGATGTATVKVTVNPAPNKPPKAYAGADKTITLPTSTVSLAGSGEDEDGTIVSYKWTKVSGPSEYNIVNPNSAVTDAFGLVEGVYEFQLEVTDNKGAKGRDTMKVTVNTTPNKAPTANAGQNQTITLPTNKVTMKGSGTDEDGTITAYEWTKTAGPNGYTIVSPSSATTEVKNLTEGTYTFQLKVTDDKGATGTATVKVTVNPAPNKAPTANAGQNQTITLPTNTVTLNGSGTDEDGTITAYEWTKTAGPNGYTIVSPNSATTEVRNLTEGTYTFQLKVTDNKGATGTATVKVTVNPAPNKPPKAYAGADKTITLPTSTVSLAGSGEDGDGTIVSYNWTKVKGPSAYNIVNPNSAVTDAFGLVEGVYEFQLEVTDNKGAKGRDTMKVTVNAVPNKAPKANAGQNQTITLPTNTVTLSGSGTDEDGTITGYQWSKVSGPVSYSITSPSSATTEVTALVEGTYKFRLKVTDNKGATGTADVTITVNAAVNQPPVANAGGNKTIVYPENSVVLTGRGTDSDGTIEAYSWRQLTGPESANIVASENAQTEVNGLKVGNYEFELTVTDDKGASGKDTMMLMVGAPRIFTYEEGVSVYPNPTLGITTMEITGVKVTGQLVMIVSDANGRVLERREIYINGAYYHKETIDLSLYRNGLYFITLVTPDKVQINRKVIRL